MSCWTAQTIGLCNVVGFLTAKNSDAKIMLVAEMTALSLAMIGFFLGGKLINYNRDNVYPSLGKMFLVLTLLFVLVLVVSSLLGIGGIQHRLIMGLCIVGCMAFFIFDTQLILDGRYGNVRVEDSVYASMKLFADFVLIFSVLIKMC